MSTYILLVSWLLVLVATYFYAGVAAGSNAYQIDRDYDVSHTWETRERLIALGGFAVIAFWQQPSSWWLAPLAFATAGLVFGLRFDMALNRRRNKAWWYTGLDVQTAWLDRQVYRFAQWRKGTAFGKLEVAGKTYVALKVIGIVLATSLAFIASSCTSARPRPADLPLLSALNLLEPDSAAVLPATVAAASAKRPCWLNPFCKGTEPITKTTKFKNKGTIIYQMGDGNTAATATKPGTMATGAGATAVDAKKADAPVQTGTANVATDNTKSGQKGGAAANGEGSTATTTTKKGGAPLWLYLLGGLLIFAGGVYVGVNFAPSFSWLRRGAKLAGLACLLWLSTSCTGSRYSYQQARETKRWHRNMVRHYRQFNAREFRQQGRQHEQRLRGIREQQQHMKAQNKTIHPGL